MWLVAGLGNPGSKYDSTRHNIGFVVESELRRRAGADEPRDKFGAALAQGSLCGNRAVFIRPLEYMNLSGQAVGKTARFFKIDVPKIIVVHDEIDLSFGRLKLGSGGGTGGHNGLKSIINHLSSKEFLRVRVGVGRPQGGRETSDHVLGRFNPDENAELPQLVERACDAVEAMIQDGIDKAMNTFNAAKTK